MMRRFHHQSTFRRTMPRYAIPAPPLLFPPDIEKTLIGFFPNAPDRTVRARDRRISGAAHAQKDALATEALTLLPAVYAPRVAGSIPIRSRQNCANSSASAARKT